MIRSSASLRGMPGQPKLSVGCLAAASLGFIAMAALALRPSTPRPELVEMPHGEVPEPQWWLSS